LYKRGTPEYDLWRDTPKYDLWRKRISVAMTGKRMSEETKQKISEAKIGERNPFYGKHHSAATLAKMSATRIGKQCGEQNPMYGKHHSVVTLAKMSAAEIGKQRGERHPMYGKHPSTETLAKMSAIKIGKHPSDETRAKTSAAMTGEQNPSWRGGISFEPYPTTWTAHFRKAIRKRDNHTCALCSKVQGEKRFAVHHINYDKEDLRPENLVTLCKSCHSKTGSDREYWTNLFEMVYVPDFSKWPIFLISQKKG